MNRPRVQLLVLGANGQAARELLGLSAQRGVTTVGLPRLQCDIADCRSVEHALDRYEPELIVNCAAYTSVDKAESEETQAFRINAEGSRILAEEAVRRAIPLLHISTDYVFDGAKASAYQESDAVAPLGVYGRSKLAGEEFIRTANPQHVILRTAWVYGVYGQNFLKTMVRLAQEREELRVVGDQRGCPTSTADIAEAILAVARRIKNGSPPVVWGTYHFTGSGETSWHGFAKEIVRVQAEKTGKTPLVTQISTCDYPTAARRPANSVLDSNRFTETFDYTALNWQERTEQTVSALLSS